MRLLSKTKIKWKKWIKKLAEVFKNEIINENVDIYKNLLTEYSESEKKDHNCVGEKHFFNTISDEDKLIFFSIL